MLPMSLLSLLPHRWMRSASRGIRAPGSSNSVVILFNLKASTAYTAYSYAAQGNQMSFADMLSSGVQSFTTSCCKSVFITADKYAPPRHTPGLLSISLESLPSSSVLSVTLDVLHSSVSHKSMLFPPNSFFFYPSSLSAYVSMSYSATLPSGFYSISVTLGGAAASEYSVEFVNGLSAFTLLSNSCASVPAAPVLTSATYQPSGVVLLQFDSPTDKAL